MRVRVLPVPGPASTKSGPWSHATAAFWLSSSSCSTPGGSGLASRSGGRRSARIIWFMTRDGGKLEFGRNFGGALAANEVFVPKPIGWAQKFAGEDVGLHFLAFARRIAFDPPCPAIDRIAAQPVRPDRHFIVRIAMEAKVPDLVGNDDAFLDRIEILGDVHEPRRPVERAQCAGSESVRSRLQAIVLDRRRNDAGGAAVPLSPSPGPPDGRRALSGGCRPRRPCRSVLFKPIAFSLG